MNDIFFNKTQYTKNKKGIFFLPWIFVFIFFLLSLCSCTRKIEYFSYVSELRNNIFTYENDTFVLRACSLEKESPYVADGIPCEKNVRTEIYIVAKGIDEHISIFFQVGENKYGGETSYDNVKGEYFFACPVSTAHLSALNFSICYGEEVIHGCATSVCPAETLSAKEVLHSVIAAEKELFNSLTDKYGFAGEIYMRLLYEDAPFYYVGVINRKSEVTAFLVNAVTGRVLAKRVP